MTPEQYQRLKSIFLHACECDDQARATYLDTACGSDAGLRREIERLFATERREGERLEALQASGGLLRILSRVASESASTEDLLPLPDRIGRYRILRRIGAGSMGIVYEARQLEPDRRVALKVVRAGVASVKQLRRFRHEAEVLAQLHHPGIASVYEAGTADLGAGEQPFFAMELIEGPTLLEFANQHGLGIRERLELMARIGDAVHHAHQKGVIHRDLKPSNILVESSPDATVAGGQPRVLDFGIARVTDVDTQTVTLQTDVGQLLGTLPYMSPEQAAADPSKLDIRSDVYALGVILFELLSGRLPHELRGYPVHEAVRVIREQSPANLSSVDRTFRGDLDTIAATALAHEPERRYQSAAEFSADLRRYLRDEPIVARPPTTMYQLRKFARRNRALVTGITGIMLALTIGTVVSIGFALRAARNADEARSGELSAQRLAYRAAIASASAALQHHDVSSARARLEEAPAALRNWEWRYLHARLDRSLRVLAGPDASPHGVPTLAAFTPDGQQLRLAGGSAVLCSVLSGQTMEPTRPIDGRLLGMTADGERLAIGTSDWSIELRDPGTGRVYSRLEDDVLRSWGETRKEGQRGWVEHLVFNADGTRCAANRLGPRSLVVFDLVSNIRLASFESPARVRSICLAPSGQRLLVGRADGAVEIRDATTGTLERTIAAHDDEVTAIAVGARGGRVATASRNASVSLWNDQGALIARLDGHSDQIDALAFAPQGGLLASAGSDRTIRLWDQRDGRSRAVLHGDESGVLGLAFSPAGDRLVSVNAANTVRIWDTGSLDETGVLRGHESYVYGVALSPDDATIASVGWGDHPGIDFAVRFWDAASGELFGTCGRGHRAYAAWFDPTGTRLAVRFEATVAAWDATTGVFAGDRRFHVWEHAARVDADGGRLLVTRSVWDPPPDDEPGTWTHARRGPGRALVATVGASGTPGVDRVDMWDAASGLRCALVQVAGLQDLAFAPDGRAIAAAGVDGVLVFDPRSGATLAALNEHAGTMFSVCYSPDGTRLAAGGADRVIHLWDTGSYDEVAQLHGHRSYIKQVVFSRDETMLMSASGDHTVRIWDVRPDHVRLQARATRAAAITRLEAMADRLLAEHGDARVAVESLGAAMDLTPRERVIAQQIVMGRSLSRSSSDSLPKHD